MNSAFNPLLLPLPRRGDLVTVGVPRFCGVLKAGDVALRLAPTDSGKFSVDLSWIGV